ncbi:MAG: hypothetical protein Q4B67_00055 [Eubacteriales bacterium]|nr:hypothetical protein [Eubacteriales bacterium]
MFDIFKKRRDGPNAKSKAPPGPNDWSDPFEDLGEAYEPVDMDTFNDVPDTDEKRGGRSPNDKRIFKGKVPENLIDGDGKRIVRIEELRERADNGEYDDLDPEMIISTYIPHRRAKHIGAALLRLGKLRLFLLTSLLLVCILFIMAFMQEKMGNFTINLNRLEMYRKGIAISEDGAFTRPTARLIASPVKDATNISIDDLPLNLHKIDGDHNGTNYMAYTYYIRNAGKEDVSYRAIVTLESASKGAEEAVRVAVWNGDECTVYAAPSRTGEPEEGCVNFISRDIVCIYNVDDFEIGNVNKYTIVIWLEGDDPECVDRIVGGNVQFAMNIDATGTDDTTLLYKFVRDIVDTLTGNKPISAAGTESPDYYKYRDVTWETRKNKPAVEVDSGNGKTETTKPAKENETKAGAKGS